MLIFATTAFCTSAAAIVLHFVQKVDTANPYSSASCTATYFTTAKSPSYSVLVYVALAMAAASVLSSGVVAIYLIVLLVKYVSSDHREAAGSDGLGAEAVARRIQPIGSIQVKDASDAGALKTGEQVFNAQCTACHTSGAAGAPKIADNAAWAARVATGYEALLTSALKGKGAMGAQGGGDFSDVEVGRAVVYIANKSGANFAEPKAPAAAASAAN